MHFWEFTLFRFTWFGSIFREDELIVGAWINEIAENLFFEQVKWLNCIFMRYFYTCPANVLYAKMNGACQIFYCITFL